MNDNELKKITERYNKTYIKYENLGYFNYFDNEHLKFCKIKDEMDTFKGDTDSLHLVIGEDDKFDISEIYDDIYSLIDKKREEFRQEKFKLLEIIEERKNERNNFNNYSDSDACMRKSDKQSE